MEAIGLNPIRLDAIGVDPIRMNAIKLGCQAAVPGSGGSYIDPEVLDALVGIWIADQNTNESPTRNIIKNKLSDRGGDFEILNAAYKLNSGYGKYEEDFTRFRSPFGELATVKHDIYHIKGTISKGEWLFYLTNTNKTNQIKVSISGLNGNYSILYDYHQDNSHSRLTIEEDGVYDIPANDGLGDARGSGFLLAGISGDTNIDITIKQIPSYQGAFVTDGVDDLIVSQKTISEMLGGGNEFTVVSMWANLNDLKNRINVIRNNDTNYSQLYCSRSNIKDKCYIGGYSYSKGTFKIINNILGDKNDYVIQNLNVNLSVPLSVEGYLNTTSNTIGEVSAIAYYNTFIAKRVLTTDEINQVIAYYELDKYVAPDIYYDVKKQGLTNENHADFGDKLIDYSGNGKDMQLYNFGWKLDSSVGKYDYDYTNTADFWLNKINATFTSSKATVLSTIAAPMSNIIFTILKTRTYEGKIKVTGLESLISKGEVTRIEITSISNNIRITKDGIYDINSDSNTETLILLYSNTKEVPLSNELIIEQIPSFENALVFDGVEDYGQYVGDLGLKDYTVVADRAYVEYTNRGVPFVSSIKAETGTPFIMEYLYENAFTAYSFGSSLTKTNDFNRIKKISYQSSYVYDGNSITKGTVNDKGSGLTIGRFGGSQQYAKLCLWNFMLFPYSLSEFLLERQLKKRKIGTLYPNMVEFRPVIKADMSTILDISFYLDDSQTISAGEYIPINSNVSIRIDLKKYQLDEVSLLKVNGQTIQMIKLGDYWKGNFTVTKSPQKVYITVDEYIRYEDIVQPYPALFSFYETENPDKVLTWGSNLKIGSTIKVKTITHLLGGLYGVKEYVYNDEVLSYIKLISKEFVVKNNLSFRANVNYKFNNDPKCILSPERLRIPNSSYKILGYIPDISGNGNHGKLNNSAYAEGSGANTDGSYKLDGVDDFISIPTLSAGGRQVLMKVNWKTDSGILYDQRTTFKNSLAIYTLPASIAYENLNYGGATYIDGILNNSITASVLKEITHNITVTNSPIIMSSTSPKIGTNFESAAMFANMSLYTFMLFDVVSTEEEIKELNEIVGIEGNTNDLFNPTN